MLVLTLRHCVLVHDQTCRSKRCSSRWQRRAAMAEARRDATATRGDAPPVTRSTATHAAPMSNCNTQPRRLRQQLETQRLQVRQAMQPRRQQQRPEPAMQQHQRQRERHLSGPRHAPCGGALVGCTPPPSRAARPAWARRGRRMRRLAGWRRTCATPSA